MNVDIVVTQYEAGGAQKAAVNLANLMLSAGVKPRLVFLYKRSEADLGMHDAVDVVFLQGDVSRIRKILHAPLKLRYLWVKSKPDVVISFTHYANIISALCAKSLSIPIVVSHRNPRTAYARVTKILDRFLYRMKFYSVVTYVSQSTEETFRTSYANSDAIPSFVIHNCVIQGPQHLTSSIREGQDRFVVSVGRLTRQKNHEILIRAMMTTSYPGKLYIIGNGPLRDELEDLIERSGLSERVILKGVLPNSEVLRLLRSADAFLMPSLYEGMSNALLEAIVNRVHTVVSDVPPQREAVETDGRIYGSVAATNDPVEWQRALDQLLAGAIDEKVYLALVDRYSPGRFCEGFLRAVDAAAKLPV